MIISWHDEARRVKRRQYYDIMATMRPWPPRGSYRRLSWRRAVAIIAEDDSEYRHADDLRFFSRSMPDGRPASRPRRRVRIIVEIAP